MGSTSSLKMIVEKGVPKETSKFDDASPLRRLKKTSSARGGAKKLGSDSQDEESSAEESDDEDDTPAWQCI